MYNNISQILLLYKTWRYYNKFDSPKSLRVWYLCVKTSYCGYMDHGLKHIPFYVQKRVEAMGMCYNPALYRNKPLGAPASVKWVYWLRPCSVIDRQRAQVCIHEDMCGISPGCGCRHGEHLSPVVHHSSRVGGCWGEPLWRRHTGPIWRPTDRYDGS